MSCVGCGQTQSNNPQIELKALTNPPFNSTDIQIYNSKTQEIEPLSDDDWPPDRNKLLLFFPATFTPVCQTEMGALNDWVKEFNKLDTDVFAATADSAEAVKEWFESEDMLKDSTYKIISSYILPSRLRIIHNGRSKRASVFITKDGDIVVQEHFMKVGRSIKELHRTMHAYSTGSYCAESWSDPLDGFLKDDNNA